jgi:histidine triad (HIT) family protein
MRGCVFCAIALGESPAHRVLDESGCIAFLDARPLFPGHVLVVPREHRETLAETTEEELAVLLSCAKRLAAAQRSALGAEGTFIAMNDRVSQSVPHVHVHVVPRRKGDGLRGFFWPRHAYANDAEAAAIASKLCGALRLTAPASGPAGSASRT